jgi:hypothetical protein
MEGGVQGTGLDLEQVFRGPPNMFGDGVAMGGSCKQRAQDEEVERALQQLYTGRQLSMHCVGILLKIV